MRLTDQRGRSATNRSSKRGQRRNARSTNIQQPSKVTKSANRQQHITKRAQISNAQQQQQTLTNQYVWPTAIPTQLKEYCLQDFCNHMSMSVLRQSTCVICNVRAYADTMKKCALQDIPSVDKLSCHVGLTNIISKTQQITEREILGI